LDKQRLVDATIKISSSAIPIQKYRYKGRLYKKPLAEIGRTTLPLRSYSIGMKQTLFFAILAICGLASCDIINPDEDIPAYIHIEPFEFTIGPDQGAGTTRITEGYLFVGPDYLGTYSLPLTVPVLFEGNQPIQVWPGVHDNGVAALPNVYPFYTIYQTELDLVPGNVDTLRPETAYRTDINFLVESFISNSNIFVNDLDNDTTTNLVNTLLDGQPVGRFDLDLDHPQIVDGTIILNELPPRSREMYLELEYRSDVDINIGVQGFDGNGLRIFPVPIAEHVREMNGPRSILIYQTM